MAGLSLVLLTLINWAMATPLFRRQAPRFTYANDAPFSIPSETLAAALTCPNGSPNSTASPVLLVHGTSTTGAETWGEGYVPALISNGYTPCYVTLPGRAMGDMQLSSEYIAYGLHYISYLSGGQQAAVISHSQGGPDTQWALQFWPSTRNITSCFVALSPDFHGILLFETNLSKMCVGDLCQDSLWQQSNGSHFYNALHYQRFEAQVPTTAIWTKYDGVVMPPRDNANLPSATVVSVQELCPGRLTNHIEIPIDAAAFALALDALKHGSTASLSRVRPNALETCLELTAEHMDIKVAAQIEAALDDVINGFLLGSPRVSEEPPVMPYAAPSSGD